MLEERLQKANSLYEMAEIASKWELEEKNKAGKPLTYTERSKISNFAQEALKKQAMKYLGLDKLPESRQNKIWDYAWQKGHLSDTGKF